MFREIVGWKQTLPLHLLLLVLLYLNICLFQMHCGSSSWLETGGAWGASSVFFFCGFPLTRVQGFYDQTPRKQTNGQLQNRAWKLWIWFMYCLQQFALLLAVSMDSPWPKASKKPWKDEDFPSISIASGAFFLKSVKFNDFGRYGWENIPNHLFPTLW